MSRAFECKRCPNSYQGDNQLEDIPMKDIKCAICGKKTLRKAGERK